MTLPRVAVICDLLEENWPSMDLVADMLIQFLNKEHSNAVSATRVRPVMRRRFVRVKSVSVNLLNGDGQLSRFLFNADRLVSRFWDYPRYARRHREEFDLFHIVDHSYGQLVHSVPPERTIVTCHDIDAFQSLLQPTCEPRQWALRKMAGRILSGLRMAARVVCVTTSVRDQLLGYGLLSPDRVTVVPNGVHPACSPEPEPAADLEATRLLGPERRGAIDLLHVGSTIPRKRIDILLRVFASVRREFPEARLLRVGGAFTTSQIELVGKLDLNESIVVLPFLDRDVLAAVYRRAALVMLPSDGEGFGLPVIEAMACGTPVVASDLPVLREVGGDAAVYCTVGDVSQWSDSVSKLLTERSHNTARWCLRKRAGISQSSNFSWAEHARQMVSLYLGVLNENAT